MGKNINNLESFKEIYQMMGEYRIGQIIAFYGLLDVYTNLEEEEDEGIRFLTQMTLEDFKKNLFLKNEKKSSSCKLFFLTGSISLLLYYFL